MRSRSQAGNTSVLLLFSCIVVIQVAVAGLDIFSILYARRATQMAADAAVMGALRAVQLEVGPRLVKAANSRVEGWLDEAEEEYEAALERWRDRRDRARERCEDQATDEEGNYDDEVYDDCMEDWYDSHSRPRLERYRREKLEEEIADPNVVDWLMGIPIPTTPEEYVTAVLSQQDQYCILLAHRLRIEEVAEIEARKYAQLNKAELIGVEVPYQNKAQVYVWVERPIPTVLLERISGQSLVASGESAGTVGAIDDPQEVWADEC